MFSQRIKKDFKDLTYVIIKLNLEFEQIFDDRLKYLSLSVLRVCFWHTLFYFEHALYLNNIEGYFEYVFLGVFSLNLKHLSL